MLPSQLPLYDTSTRTLSDGTAVTACSFCRKKVDTQECVEHYARLATKPEGYYECPFGFTSRNFFHEQKMWVVTGVVAFPRFNSRAERDQAKHFPNNRTARETIEVGIRFLKSLDEYRAAVIQDASKVLPQAFHELRKLNGAVIQHAEREIKERGETRGLLSIKSAAELMRNNFDILEALSNIEGMRALAIDSTVNVYDITFKMKRVLEERANDKEMRVSVNGERLIIKGSQKSFPIVPAVLLENAIKYGRKGRTITASIQSTGSKAVLIVENESEAFIDPVRCFERGARFSDTVEGGGFGLYIAKAIVEAHSGSIRCESLPGVVRMIVELPLVKVIGR